MNFRNLALLALLFTLISSYSIPEETHRHMMRIHESAVQYIHRQQDNSNAANTQFVSQTDKTVQSISDSIQPSVPSIYSTKNLPTYTFNKATCQSLTSNQKDPLIKKTRDTKAKVQNFSKNLTSEEVKSNATNAIKYLDLIDHILNRNCGDFDKIWFGPSPLQTNINTNKFWIYGGVTKQALTQEYINRANKYDNLTNCDDKTPFFNGNQCIACSDALPIFNISSAKCIKCPDGMSFDLSSRTCIGKEVKQVKPNRKVGQPLVILGQKQTQKDIDTFFSGNGADCPIDSPFVLAGKCSPCPQDKPYLSLQTKLCATCPAGFTLNTTSHKCIQGKPQATDVNVQNPTLKMNDNSTNEDWNKYVDAQKNKILCPLDKPYWNDKECIPCPVYFNIITKKCDVCQPTFALSTNSHKCQPAQPLEPYLIDLVNTFSV